MYENYELIKPAVSRLYGSEGKSIEYIARLFNIDKDIIDNLTDYWKIEKAHKINLTPSNVKFLNKNRQLIKSRLDNNIPISRISKELKVTEAYLSLTIIPADMVLSTAKEQYLERIKKAKEEKKEEIEKRKKHDYLYANDFPLDEQWKPILGYPNYEVSDKARIRKYLPEDGAYILRKIQVNTRDNRNQISVWGEDGRHHSLRLARVVAHAFCEQKDPSQNTVNHKDGNTLNDVAENLEWMTQAENNRHMFEENGVTHLGKKNKFKGCTFLYKDKYEFKTIQALANFIGKSRTQTGRYLENPQKYDIKVIKKNCND